MKILFQLHNRKHDWIANVNDTEYEVADIEYGYEEPTAEITNCLIKALKDGETTLEPGDYIAIVDSTDLRR